MAASRRQSIRKWLVYRLGYTVNRLRVMPVIRPIDAASKYTGTDDGVDYRAGCNCIGIGLIIANS